MKRLPLNITLKTGAFTSPQFRLIHSFIDATKETMFDSWLYSIFPHDHRVYFYNRNFGSGISYPIAFLWVEMQMAENLIDRVLRVHALYIRPPSMAISQKITKTFERILSSEAKLRGIKEIGFYTRRNPEAFMRRLNRTAPHPWQLDSYVITRKV